MRLKAHSTKSLTALIRHRFNLVPFCKNIKLVYRLISFTWVACKVDWKKLQTDETF